MTAFELWDTRSHNLVGDYDTEAAALNAVSESVRKYGIDEGRSLMLVRVGPRGGVTRLAVGSELTKRAMKTRRLASATDREYRPD